jgi:hypothetical protein
MIGKKNSLASFIVTGDLRGFHYIEKSIKEFPDKTFNFCCTIDGGIKD